VYIITNDSLVCFSWNFFSDLFNVLVVFKWQWCDCMDKHTPGCMTSLWSWPSNRLLFVISRAKMGAVVQGLRDVYIRIKLQQRYAPFVNWKEDNASPEKRRWTYTPSHFKYQNHCLCWSLLSIDHFANNLLEWIQCHTILDSTCACAHGVLAWYDIILYVKNYVTVMDT